MLTVQFTKLAIKDLNNSYDYIYSSNPFAAASVIRRIQFTISQIAEHPTMGRKGRVAKTFEFVVPNTPFIIVYMFDHQYLNIVSILHSARRYP